MRRFLLALFLLFLIAACQRSEITPPSIEEFRVPNEVWSGEDFEVFVKARGAEGYTLAYSLSFAGWIEDGLLDDGEATVRFTAPLSFSDTRYPVVLRVYYSAYPEIFSEDAEEVLVRGNHPPTLEVQLESEPVISGLDEVVNVCFLVSVYDLEDDAITLYVGHEKFELSSGEEREVCLQVSADEFRENDYELTFRFKAVDPHGAESERDVVVRARFTPQIHVAVIGSDVIGARNESVVFEASAAVDDEEASPDDFRWIVVDPSGNTVVEGNPSDLRIEDGWIVFRTTVDSEMLSGRDAGMYQFVVEEESFGSESSASFYYYPPSDLEMRVEFGGRDGAADGTKEATFDLKIDGDGGVIVAENFLTVDFNFPEGEVEVFPDPDSVIDLGKYKLLRFPAEISIVVSPLAASQVEMDNASAAFTFRAADGYSKTVDFGIGILDSKRPSLDLQILLLSSTSFLLDATLVDAFPVGATLTLVASGDEVLPLETISFEESFSGIIEFEEKFDLSEIFVIYEAQDAVAVATGEIDSGVSMDTAVGTVVAVWPEDRYYNDSIVVNVDLIVEDRGGGIPSDLSVDLGWLEGTGILEGSYLNPVEFSIGRVVYRLSLVFKDGEELLIPEGAVGVSVRDARGNSYIISAGSEELRMPDRPFVYDRKPPDLSGATVNVAGLVELGDVDGFLDTVRIVASLNRKSGVVYEGDSTTVHLDAEDFSRAGLDVPDGEEVELRIEATDRAGNSSEISLRQVMDLLPPSVSADEPIVYITPSSTQATVHLRAIEGKIREILLYCGDTEDAEVHVEAAGRNLDLENSDSEDPWVVFEDPDGFEEATLLVTFKDGAVLDDGSYLNVVVFAVDETYSYPIVAATVDYSWIIPGRDWLEVIRGIDADDEKFLIFRFLGDDAFGIVSSGEMNLYGDRVYVLKLDGMDGDVVDLDGVVSFTLGDWIIRAYGLEYTLEFVSLKDVVPEEVFIPENVSQADALFCIGYTCFWNVSMSAELEIHLPVIDGLEWRVEDGEDLFDLEATGSTEVIVRMGPDFDGKVLDSGFLGVYLVADATALGCVFGFDICAPVRLFRYYLGDFLLDHSFNAEISSAAVDGGALRLELSLSGEGLSASTEDYYMSGEIWIAVGDGETTVELVGVHPIGVTGGEENALLSFEIDGVDLEDGNASVVIKTDVLKAKVSVEGYGEPFLTNLNDLSGP